MNKINLGLTTKESKMIKTILKDLFGYLQGDWLVVGGLPFRYYFIQHGKSWKYPFKDLDLILRKKEVLSPKVLKSFYTAHYHSSSNGFYFQLIHHSFPKVRVDIFTDHVGEENRQIYVLGIPVRIPIPEEMYLFKLRDILLLLDHPRGLPLKHIEQLRLLRNICNRRKTEAIWQRRHKNPPEQDNQIYKFASLELLEKAVEKNLEKKKENIKEWIRSNPLAPCAECVRDLNFPLYRERANRHQL